jgi:nucleoid DNA-binding protein
MGSTSLGVPYFRSAKNNKVIEVITKYLLQYRKVAIPYIGSFEIRYEPARLDVADKQMIAPTYVTEYSSNDSVRDHQYNYFTSSLNAERNKVSDDLALFGEQLNERLSSQPVVLNGLGILKKAGQRIVFEPQESAFDGLQPVAASKVIRENASHTVLVGERERNSIEMAESLQASPEQKSYLNLIGWILFILAAAAIVYFLYKDSFNPSGAGLN